MSIPLLMTRFYPPPPAPHRVPRVRLFDLLSRESLRRPLVLLSAPAGFGKSTLISEWLYRSKEDGLEFAWLSLETSDNDLQRFFRYLIAAWQKIFPQIGESALAEARSTQLPDNEALVTLLLNDLLAAQDAAGEAHHLLVLDDYQRIEAAPIQAAIAYLIEHLPQRCHLALLTRIDPPLPLPLWRSRGLVLELRTDDLRFSSAEATEFLNAVMGLDLSARQIEVLESRTEGWIAGLQMAALSLQGREDRQEFVSAFGGSHRFVLDYLVEEVVDQQPKDVQEFLLSTALLDRFCGPLCDAILGMAQSQLMLGRLEKANLFLIPLDDRRQWYRYHHLFAELLRVRLRQLAPDRIPESYRRAARWHAQNGFWPEAIGYALRAQDLEGAARLFEQAILTGRLDFLFGGTSSLIESFSEDQVARRPLLSLARAVYLIERAHLEGIEPLLRAAEQGIKLAPAFDGQKEILGAIYAVQGHAASLLGDTPWITEACQLATNLLPEADPAYAVALVQLGNVYFYRGDLLQVEHAWSRALELSRAMGDVYMTLAGLDNLGRLGLYQGELRTAEAHFQNALKIASPYGNRYLRWISSVQRDYSDLLREWDCLEEAQLMIEASLNTSQKYDTVSGRGLGYIHWGRILVALGDLDGAQAALNLAEGLCRAHTVYPDLTAAVLLFRVQLTIAQRNLDQAWSLLDAYSCEACFQYEFHHEWWVIVQSRLLLRLNRPREALSLLSGKPDAVRELRRGRNWLEMTLISALSKKALGEDTEALALLDDTLAYAQPQGFMRIFLDEGEPMRALLEQHRARQTLPAFRDYRENLLADFPTPAAGNRSKNENMIEPLTERELEVLYLLCQGLSNTEIAGKLVLSVGTVKTHVHNIFGKLGVRDRPQAIAQAMQMGLVR